MKKKLSSEARVSIIICAVLIIGLLSFIIYSNANTLFNWNKDNKKTAVINNKVDEFIKDDKDKLNIDWDKLKELN